MLWFEFAKNSLHCMSLIIVLFNQLIFNLELLAKSSILKMEGGNPIQIVKMHKWNYAT